MIPCGVDADGYVGRPLTVGASGDDANVLSRFRDDLTELVEDSRAGALALKQVFDGELLRSREQNATAAMSCDHLLGKSGVLSGGSQCLGVRLVLCEREARIKNEECS